MGRPGDAERVIQEMLQVSPNPTAYDRAEYLYRLFGRPDRAARRSRPRRKATPVMRQWTGSARWPRRGVTSRSWRSSARAVASSWWWLLAPAFTIAPRADRNVLLVTIDTLRADALGSYGGRAATPNLDGLAAPRRAVHVRPRACGADACHRTRRF